MNAESDKLGDTIADRLASFDDKLRTTSVNVDMLADIQEGFGSLLESDENSEGEIRRILQERYEAGDLRKETFQLVKSMLDRYVTENVPTYPSSVEMENRTTPPLPAIDEHPESLQGDDAFGATTVIPVDVAADTSAGSRVQVGSVLRDRFLLQEKVSGGSMGVVYKALDRRLAEVESDERWVAIKVLSPELAQNVQALRALQQEAAKGRCLVHPNIVRFIDLDRDDDLYFLILEWLEGRTLADILDSDDHSVIDHDAAFRIIRQVGEALDYAHRCGIVHADVKPGNVMIMPNGDAKLFDFGVARVRQQRSDSAFDPGVIGALTPAYASMQVLTGDEPAATDDIFSLACLLYRLVAGYRVFGPRNAAEAAEEGMKPQRPQSLGDNQWRALKKALSNARVARFESVRDFLNALEDDTSEPIRAEVSERLVVEERGGSGGRLAALLLVLGILGAAGYQFGYFDSLLERLGESREATVDDAVEPAAPPDSSADAEPVEMGEPDVETPAVTASEAPVAEDVAAVSPEISVVRPDPNPMGPDPMLVDFSTLPPADVIVSISKNRRNNEAVDVVLREDGEPVIVDFVRDGNLSRPLTLRLDEVGFSGNRSPWASGQYAYSNSGVVQFPTGQDRGRITLTMASDPLREADQQSTLRLRDIDFAASELAVLNVALEDDDQRAFESGLPVNTVAFATSQTSIRETDPAVQIDIVRFNPDSSTVTVEYVVNDITATEGEDYFAPGGSLISFAPQQRSARLLIPLVQDADVEGDEAFVIELQTESESSALDVYQRVVVMIRDDEPQIR